MGSELFKNFVDSYGDKTYYSSRRMDSGQTACIMFTKIWQPCGYEYAVGFGIGRSRKQVMDYIFNDKNYLDLKSSGRCGIDGLLWARREIEKFEKWILKKDTSARIEIFAGAADERRFRAYKRGLERLGYKGGGWWCGAELRKRIR